MGQEGTGANHWLWRGTSASSQVGAWGLGSPTVNIYNCEYVTGTYESTTKLWVLYCDGVYLGQTTVGGAGFNIQNTNVHVGLDFRETESDFTGCVERVLIYRETLDQQGVLCAIAQMNTPTVAVGSPWAGPLTTCNGCTATKKCSYRRPNGQQGCFNPGNEAACNTYPDWDTNVEATKWCPWSGNQDGDGGGDGGGDGDRRLAAGNPCLPLPTTPGRAAFDVCEVPATSLAGLSVGLDQDTSIALEDAGEGENGVPFDAFVKHEGDGSYSVAFADRCGPAKLREIALTFELGVHGELCLEDDAFHSFALHDLSNVVAEPAFTSCNGGLGSSHTFTISDATDLPAERRAVAVGYRDYVSALHFTVHGAVTVKGDADAVCDDPVPDDEPKSMLGRLAGFW
jgi:hypothetical protein